MFMQLVSLDDLLRVCLKEPCGAIDQEQRAAVQGVVGHLQVKVTSFSLPPAPSATTPRNIR